jgi:protein SCO1/2
MRYRTVLLNCALVLLATSCGKNSDQTAPTSPPPSVAAANTRTQIFQVNGVVVALDADGETVKIKHEAIPDYMPAMTMPFTARNTNELRGLAAGDAVTFRMTVTDTDGWIDQIKKTGTVANTLPPDAPIRIVRDVEPLAVGDALPEYHFTNQLGQAVSLSQFRGQALALTFIFTRCPFPTFCPLMSNNFREVQNTLLQNPNAPTNWHLLTLTFDPEYDTPARLKTYAEGYQCDPRHWSFLTGPLVDVTALGEQFGLQFWRDPQGSISHNLRTVVVDARGRVQKIFTENKWTTTELVEEVAKAAAVK